MDTPAIEWRACVRCSSARGVTIMGVRVVTENDVAEDEVTEYDDADGWDVVDGMLDVSEGEEVVATFASGMWEYVEPV